MIKYSIIVPHYNIPNLLVRCLNSIPDRNDIQVIVVDDNSADENAFWKAILEVGHHNVEAYVTKEGRGAGYARNVALKYAQGVWLLFADADDFFVDGFVDTIEKYSDSDLEVVYFNVVGCNSDNVSILNGRGKDSTFDAFEQTKDERIFRFCYPEPWGKMVRHSLVTEKNISFDETMVSNDYLFSIKVGYYAESLQADRSILYAYTLRVGSLSHKDLNVNVDKLMQRLVAFAHVQRFMEECGYYTVPTLVSSQLVGLFKNNTSVYYKGMQVVKEVGLSRWHVLRDTMMHYVKQVQGNKNYSIGLDAYKIEWKKK